MNGKIAFFGIFSDHNFGDPILGECCIKLYQNQLLLERSQILPLGIDVLPYEYNSSLNFLLKVSDRFSFIKDVVRKSEFRIRTYLCRKKLKSILKDCKCIVFAGGGIIKFSTQFFGDTIFAVTRIAEDYSIPIIYNSIGIEGYDNNNWKCQLLKKCLNSNSVLSVSTRDDYELLMSQYIMDKKRIDCRKVADPAVWSSFCYNIKKQEGIKIGVNIGKGTLFSAYGISFSSSDLKSLYIDIIDTLSEKYGVFLYTNGLDSDNIFAKEIQAYYNGKIELKIPKTPTELISIISNCKGIVGTRLHSCIIAYSLDIPFVGLVWNNKLLLFGKNIGSPDYMITVDNFEPNFICNKLLYAIEYGFNSKIRDTFCESIRDSVKYNTSLLSEYDE